MTFSDNILAAINDVALWFPLLLMLFVVENFFEALFAKIAGDSTAEEAGFLTLNPVVHIEVINFIIYLLLLIPVEVFFGERFPSMAFILLPVVMGLRIRNIVPVDQNNFKWPVVGSILYALSFSFGNFVLAFLAVAGAWLLDGGTSIFAVTAQKILFTTAHFALFWVVIELIPLPPFHAGRALRYIVSESWSGVVDYLEEYALIIIMVLYCAPIVSDVFWGSIGSMANSLMGVLMSLFFN